ncbi:unnamed protein product [Spirodela intermedia]|uniref:Hexosyltransferase n=1 Tax=Spirodela intermedia TaxID=51605 RepID=A0A7I8IK23_SPIIN|nr:unnamed protein product [Spirodela intermedia]CAA6657327.1 unnamed protein product [Spirodela intermedia]
MRRRAPDFRRPARRRFVSWIWCLLLVFLALGTMIFMLQPRRGAPIQKSNRRSQRETFDLKRELSSATSFARQLVEQMTLAKAYLVMAKEQGNLKLAGDLSSQIRSCQRLLSQAATGGKRITLEEAQPVISKLAHLILKAQESHFDIATTIVTLKNHIQALEARVNAATVQSAEFGRLASEAVPRYIHCLSVKLTVDWLSSSSLRRLEEDRRNQARLVDNSLHHFCVFSDNLLAASVVVNSTVSNTDHPRSLAMRAWFLVNSFKGCTVEVRSMEEFSWLNASHSPMVKQLPQSEESQAGHLGSPKLDSLLSHLRFYIPQMFPSLEKVVFLDDDVVVQKDLAALFSLDLRGNVNGAVETCLEAFHRYHRYLNFSDPLISSRFDPQGCGWSFGMNVFDLVAWRKADLTSVYHRWQERNSNGVLWRTGTLAPGLLTFHGLTEPLDRRWHVLGLGFDPDIDNRLIESAAVLSIARYRPLWERYVDYSSPDIRSCLAQSQL